MLLLCLKRADVRSPPLLDLDSSAYRHRIESGKFLTLLTRRVSMKQSGGGVENNHMPDELHVVQGCQLIDHVNNLHIKP